MGKEKKPQRYNSQEKLDKEMGPVLFDDAEREISPEEIESEINGSDAIKDRIEEKAVDFITENSEENPEAASKMMEILSVAKSKSNEFLKKAFLGIAENSQEKVNQFRDIRLSRRARSLDKYVSNKKFHGIDSLSKNNPVSPEQLEKANKDFDLVMKKAEDFLKIVEGGNWGKSNKEFSLSNDLRRALNTISASAVNLDRERDALRIYEIVRDLALSKWTWKGGLYDKTPTHILSRTEKYLQDKNLKAGEKIDLDTVDSIFKGDPVLIMDFFSKNGAGRVEVGEIEKFEYLKTQALSLMDKYPEGGGLPDSVRGKIMEIADKYPEFLFENDDVRRYLFNVYKNMENNTDSYYQRDVLVGNLSGRLHLFKEELDVLAEEEVSTLINIIKNNGPSVYDSVDEQRLLSALPLKELHLKELQADYEFVLSESEKPKSKESFLEMSHKMTHGSIVPSFNSEHFGLSSEEKIRSLENTIGEDIDGQHPDRSSVMLQRIIREHGNLSKNLSEEEFGEIFSRALSIPRKRTSEIKSVMENANHSDLPDKYKKQIINIYAEDIEGSTVDDLFGENQSLETVEKEWIKAQPELMQKLESRFLANGRGNDVRHLFFKVLEGEREVSDMEGLISRYLKSEYEINPEELIKIFFTEKQLDLKYIGLFLSKVSSSEIISQLKEKLELEAISKEEYKKTMMLISEKGNTHVVLKAIRGIIKDDVFSDSEKKEFLVSYVGSILSKTSKDNPDKIRNSSAINMELRDLKGEISQYASDVDGYFEFLDDQILIQLKEKEEYQGALAGFLEKNYSRLSLGEDEKKEYREIFLNTNNQESINKLIYSSIFNENYSSGVWDDILGDLGKEERFALLEKALRIGNSDTIVNYLDAIGSATKEESELFVNHLLGKDDLLGSVNLDQRGNISGWLIDAAYKTDKDSVKSLKKHLPDLIDNILESENLNEKSLSDLNNNVRFFHENKELLGKMIERSKTMPFNHLWTLSMYGDKDLLSEDQVKTLSVEALKEPMSPSIYDAYVGSVDSGDNTFYMTQKLFDESFSSLEKTGVSDSSGLGSILNFLSRQRNLQQEGGKYITCSKKQEKTMSDLIFRKTKDGKLLGKLYEFDKDLFGEVMKKELSKKDGNLSLKIEGIVRSTNGASEEFKEEMIDYLFDDQYGVNLGAFKSMLDVWGNEEETIVSIKEKVKSVPQENKGVLFSNLLERDLLDPEELKYFYEQTKTDSDVREQVLINAEIFGSLVSSGKSESLVGFFEDQDGRVGEKIQYIESFVEKYKKQDKGRSIAVMLFAKEYSPDRKSDQILERVHSKILKYEKVLNRFDYSNSLEEIGLQASIGFEYEITSSTANGYKNRTKDRIENSDELTEGRSLKQDIVRLSRAAHIKSGLDAVHELAPGPTDNPYMLILEAKLLNDLEYVDFNFEKDPDLAKGARGYHLTIGGEENLQVSANTNFLQNSILMANWGGLHAGNTGMRAHGGRGVPLRGRSVGGNNVQMFDSPTSAVELRSLSLDKLEPFQRAVLTSYYGSVAIQAMNKYIPKGITGVLSDMETNTFDFSSKEGILEYIQFTQMTGVGSLYGDSRTEEILYLWIKTFAEIKKTTEKHNQDFYYSETGGYMDDDGAWVEQHDFRGEDNKKRFIEVATSIDPTMSAEELALSTKIDFKKEILSNFATPLADKMTKVNNMFIKPGTPKGMSVEERKKYDLLTEDQKIKKKNKKLAADQANALSVLETTHLGNDHAEGLDSRDFLSKTIFDTYGEKRKGYYNVQGGSEKMITHSVQKSLLEFVEEMEIVLSKPNEAPSEMLSSSAA